MESGKPFISAITLTYGRTDRLRELVQCFLNQTCRDSELLIFNSCPQQDVAIDESILLDGPTIRVVNCRERPVSLGACRNDAIALAQGEVICTWDDDDLFLSHCLEVIADPFRKDPALDWIRIASLYYAEHWRIKTVTKYAANGVAFRKTAWRSVGGYSSEISCGEDRNFVSLLAEKCKGKGLECDRPPIILCWGNGVYHISGLGDDKPGRMPAYERARTDLENRIRLRREPIGRIVVKPEFAHDPEQMVRDFLQAAPDSAGDSVGIVYLGRFGDIINILPVCQHVHNVFGTPHLVVGKEFAGVLDGVSYVKPFVLPLRHDQLVEGLQVAKKTFKHVLQPQIYGKKHVQVRFTEAYNKESWRNVGFVHKFADETWRPVFDRRDKSEEAKLRGKLNPRGLPLILTTLISAFSSPFPRGRELLRTLQEAFPDYHVLDLSDVRARRIYDLLGLIESAEVVVTIDTALLHLCAAAQTPTVALTNQQPWLGTIPRFSHCVRIPYDKVGEDFKRVIEAVKAGLRSGKAPVVPPQAIVSPPVRRLFHCVSTYPEPTERERKRKRFAIESWEAMYRCGVVACDLRAPWKRSMSHPNSTTRLPYIKDIIQPALDLARDDDVIFYTNNDIICHPDLPNQLRFYCSLWGCVAIQRCELATSPPPSLGASPEVWAQRAKNVAFRHCGRDTFAFTKRWLMERWEQIPDFVVGTTDWDNCIVIMMRTSCGITDHCAAALRILHWPAEMPIGWTAHIKHPSDWENPANIESSSANAHNRRLFREWSATYAPQLVFDRYNHLVK